MKACLYAEVIQLASRQVCWVASFALLGVFPVGFQPYRCSISPIRLAEADLLWPVTFFRPAADTEMYAAVIGLLDLRTPTEVTQLPNSNSVSSSTKSGKLTQALFRRRDASITAVAPACIRPGAIQGRNLPQHSHYQEEIIRTCLVAM